MAKGGCGLLDYHGRRPQTFLPIRSPHEHRQKSYRDALGRRPVYLRAKVTKEWAEATRALFDRMQEDFKAYVAEYALNKPGDFPETQVPSDEQVPSKFKDDDATKMLAKKHTSTDDGTPRKKKKKTNKMLVNKHKATIST